MDGQFESGFELWELPAGTLNGREENRRVVPIETPEECAARGLKRNEQSLDEDEIILEIRAFNAGELEEMIAHGAIRDAKTLVGLFYALSRSPRGVRTGRR